MTPCWSRKRRASSRLEMRVMHFSCYLHESRYAITGAQTGGFWARSVLLGAFEVRFRQNLRPVWRPAPRSRNVAQKGVPSAAAVAPLGAAPRRPPASAPPASAPPASAAAAAVGPAGLAGPAAAARRPRRPSPPGKIRSTLCARCWSPTGARSPSGLSGPSTSSATPRSRSSRTRTATRSTARRPTRATR